MTTRREVELEIIKSAIDLGVSLKRTNWYKWVKEIKDPRGGKYFRFSSALWELYKYLHFCREHSCVDGDVISLDVVEIYIKMRITLDYLSQKSEEEILRLTQCTPFEVELWIGLLDNTLSKISESTKNLEDCNWE